MTTLMEAIKIADIHKERIIKAIQHLEPLFPIKAASLEHLQEIDMLYLEMLTSRFSKLQDYIGSTLIDLFLDSQAEMTLRLSMLDKLHLLEKLGVIKDSFSWQRMREIRNHLAHEYPSVPDITAKHLNDVFYCIPDLLALLYSIKNYSK
ncbi:hypothetical protein EBR43_08505 [bacterium]|jgi:hypothetical protein|nr:hypothetical protein [bacterium]NBW57809.1 hypothetical protein [bacterium]NBX72310.1 hypothetical protein [bacterium]